MTECFADWGPITSMPRTRIRQGYMYFPPTKGRLLSTIINCRGHRLMIILAPQFLLKVYRWGAENTTASLPHRQHLPRYFSRPAITGLKHTAFANPHSFWTHESLRERVDLGPLFAFPSLHAIRPQPWPRSSSLWPCSTAYSNSTAETACYPQQPRRRGCQNLDRHADEGRRGLSE